MSTTDSTQKVSATFHVIQRFGASTTKFYSPFCIPLGDSPDLEARVRVAHEVLGLVIDAGDALSKIMAVSHETEGLSSLLDSLLGGAEYARDALVPPDDE
ncbi:MAG: hypothetical protein KDI55_22870 [Anaerolineae bacterium]|nr:hypothetical protein [Anaerolineae bacterium]